MPTKPRSKRISHIEASPSERSKPGAEYSMWGVIPAASVAAGLIFAAGFYIGHGKPPAPPAVVGTYEPGGSTVLPACDPAPVEPKPKPAKRTNVRSKFNEKG